MKLLRIAVFVAISFALLRSVSGQGFVNLDFEDAVITPDPSSPYYPNAVYSNDAIPGWTAVGFLSPNDILYNSASLGTTSVSIFGVNGTPPVLDGAFSIYLYGGGGIAAGASISQTGLVPANAASIRFIAESVVLPFGGSLLVSLGGQNIPFSAISTGPNYTVYGGNVSAFANQSEQLTFTAPNGNNNFWEIDDIQFSPSAVPEPSEFALGAIGSLLFGFHCWVKRFSFTFVVRQNG